MRAGKEEGEKETLENRKIIGNNREGKEKIGNRKI